MTLSLSICIPSKNRVADLLRCLESIERQSVHPQEVLVVDQSSPACQLPPMNGLRHIYDPTLSGLAAAKNRGAHAASGEFILFLDDDVELLPGCLQALEDFLSDHPEASGVSCAVIVDEAPRLLWWNVHAWIFAHGFFNEAPRKRQGALIELRRLSGCAVALRRSLLLDEPVDENLIDYSYGEDWELSHRLRRHGKLLLARNAKLIHHVSALNRYGDMQLQRDRWDNFLYFYDKLNASQYSLNRFWKVWWMVGQSLLWLKDGMGLPFTGLQSAKAPKRSQSFRWN